MISFDSADALAEYLGLAVKQAIERDRASQPSAVKVGECGFGYYMNGRLMRCQGSIGHLGDHGEAEGGSRCAR